MWVELIMVCTAVSAIMAVLGIMSAITDQSLGGLLGGLASLVIVALCLFWISSSSKAIEWETKEFTIYNVGNIQCVEHQGKILNLNEEFDRAFEDETIAIKIGGGYSYGLYWSDSMELEPEIKSQAGTQPVADEGLTASSEK